MMFVTKYFQALMLLAVLYGANAVVFGQDAINVSDTQEILITSVRPSEKFKETQKGDEALLIHDRSEVAKLVALFDKNIQHRVHACGYHWRLTFYRAGGLTTEIFFNEECEEFDRNTDEICEIVQSKFLQTVKRPNAYVTNIDIDVKVPPETARFEFNSKGGRVLDLHPINRFPYVEIRASATSLIPDDRSLWDSEKAKVRQKADKILLGEIERIRGKFSVVETGDLMHGMSMFGGGEIMEQRRVKLYFEVGANLDEIGKELKDSKVEEMVSPASYRLQILTVTRPTQTEFSNLKKTFPFIKAVTVY